MNKEQDLSISVGQLVVKYLDFELEFCDKDDELKNALTIVKNYVDDCIQ